MVSSVVKTVTESLPKLVGQDNYQTWAHCICDALSLLTVSDCDETTLSITNGEDKPIALSKQKQCDGTEGPETKWETKEDIERETLK